ncbi:MAG: VWA domain-containing protein [Clostridium sp.]|uniref:VWA domain-containing protein n=1 Tax=Clostridium sp. TaxID=1506 RepID=UPI003D6D6CB4
MYIFLEPGTNISRALQYCNSLMENPHKTIVILVTDLYEGRSYAAMYSSAKDIIESGAKLIILPALGIDAEPVYDRGASEKMVALGANVVAITPGGLAKWIAQIIA